jgi:uncharacterized repeat protein (TIGR01451 family)
MYTVYGSLNGDTLCAANPSVHGSVVPPFHVATSPADHLDFAVQIPPGIHDLQMFSLAAHSVFRPGFTTTLTAQANNSGSEPENGASFWVVLPGGGHLLSAAPAVTSWSGDTAFWSLPVMLPLNAARVTLEWETNASTPIYDSLIFFAGIRPGSGVVDAVPADNQSRFRAFVIGSYDPNDKTVEPEPYTTSDQQAARPLTYTVRFQNTGTYWAGRVVVEDTLSSRLDWSTFRVLQWSHPMT